MGENLFLLSKAQSVKRWEKSKLTLEEPDKTFPWPGNQGQRQGDVMLIVCTLDTM